MTDPFLEIKVRCRNNEPCLFRGQDLFLEITIRNNGAPEVRFPLDYVRKTGPVIRLYDTKTKADTYLKRNLADHALKETFTPIPPGRSVTMEWVIMADELRHFGGERAFDVFAEITVMVEVKVGETRFEFRGTDTLRIVSSEPPRVPTGFGSPRLGHS